MDIPYLLCQICLPAQAYVPMLEYYIYK